MSLHSMHGVAMKLPPINPKRSLKAKVGVWGDDRGLVQSQSLKKLGNVRKSRLILLEPEIPADFVTTRTNSSRRMTITPEIFANGEPPKIRGEFRERKGLLDRNV